jgi:hypothetical protein
MQIIVQASGIQDAYQALTLTVNQPTALQVKIDKYVSIGPILIQASLLIALLIVLATVIALLLVEVFWRRRTKSATTYAT